MVNHILLAYTIVPSTVQQVHNEQLYCPVSLKVLVCILVQVKIYRRLRISRDGHLDQFEAYDIS